MWPHFLDLLCVHIHTITFDCQWSLGRCVFTTISSHQQASINLPTPSQAQLSLNVLWEVNQAVTAALQCLEAGSQAKRGMKQNHTIPYSRKFLNGTNFCILRTCGKSAKIKTYTNSKGISEITQLLFIYNGTPDVPVNKVVTYRRFNGERSTRHDTKVWISPTCVPGVWLEVTEKFGNHDYEILF